MTRLLGILSGSALAVALLLTALGVPNLAPHQEDIELPPPPVEAAPVQEEPEPVANETSAVELPAPLHDEPVEPVPEVLVVESLPAEETPPSPAVVEIPEIIDERWYAFWSPFSSQLAANGFIAQLQRTTGLDYRVVKLKPGVYEVAFAYVDEAEIETKLARISSATGLEIPGS